ncbi:Slp family lipoprotein [Thiolapillus brandeum]|nr:Slp family lipoprotein [Thiolapillus brandeum]
MAISLLVVIMRTLLPLLMLLLLAGCNTTGGVRQPPGPMPAALSHSADPAAKGRDFTWGGSVLSIKNLKDHTLVEVMAYPLDSKGMPDVGAGTQGRFLADYRGFLEPADFPGGQLITVTGPLLGYKDGKVGEADYRYPALQADQIKHWDSTRSRHPYTKPSVNIGFGFGSGGYSNIGIGIGF